MTVIRKLRVPRQLGLTQLCRTYNLIPQSHPQQRKKVYDKVIGIILDNYIQNGFTVLGIPTTIPDLALRFNIPVKEVYKGITRTMQHLGTLTNDKESLKQTYGAILALTLQTSLAVQGSARHQTNQLLAAKKGRLWVPGLDRDLTASISAESKNVTNLLTLAKHLSGRDGNSQTIDITTQTLVQSQQDGGNYIGPNEAITMIGKGTQPLLESGTQQEGLQDKYGTDALPEIIATKQQGLKDDGTFAVKDKKRKPNQHHDGRQEDAEIIS